MLSRIVNESQRNLRSDDFLQESKTDFESNNFAKNKIGELHTEISNHGVFSEEQILKDDDAHQQYEVAQTAFANLKRIMTDVRDFAETMEDEIDGIEEKFRLPRTGGNRGRITRARVFAAEAAPYEAIMVDRGLDADFIAQLTDNAGALENAISAAQTKTGERVGATESKMLSHKKQNKIISQLNPIVRKRYRDNPAKLAAWEFASRVRRADESKPKNPIT